MIVKLRYSTRAVPQTVSNLRFRAFAAVVIRSKMKMKNPAKNPFCKPNVTDLFTIRNNSKGSVQGTAIKIMKGTS